MPNSAFRLVAFFALSAAGGVVAAFLGLPVPFLFGSALVSAFLGVTGFAPKRVPGSISVAARVTIGVLIGASIEIELIDRLPQIGLAAALVPVQVALVLAAGSALLRQVTDMTRSERLLGALPGGFASVVLSVEALGHDVSRITMYHAIRVLAIVTLVPLALAWGLSGDGASAPSARTGMLDLSGIEAGLFLLLGLAGWGLARLTRLPGGPILLPLALTVAGEVAFGLPEVPREAIPAAQTVLGALVGFRFAEGGLEALRNSLWTGLLLTVLVLAASLTPVVILHLATDLPLRLGILAFAPGGVPEISVLALSLGLDPAFVIAIHVWRMVIVLAMLPFLLRWLEREDAAAGRNRSGPAP